MRWHDEQIYNTYLTEGKKKKTVPIYKQIRKPVPPPGGHHGDKKKEDERKKARSKVDQDSYEENYSITRKMTDVVGGKTRNNLSQNQQISYATHFEGGDDGGDDPPVFRGWIHIDLYTGSIRTIHSSEIGDAIEGLEHIGPDSGDSDWDVWKGEEYMIAGIPR